MLHRWLILIAMCHPAHDNTDLSAHIRTTKRCVECVCVKNVLPCVTVTWGITSPPWSPCSHCVLAVLYCATVGRFLKKFENVCSLLFLPHFLILFGPTMALYSTMVEAVKRGQLQAWPERLNSDFMRMEKKTECAFVRAHMCLCVHSAEHSEVVPVSLHEVNR